MACPPSNAVESPRDIRSASARLDGANRVGKRVRSRCCGVPAVRVQCRRAALVLRCRARGGDPDRQRAPLGAIGDCTLKSDAVCANTVAIRRSAGFAATFAWRVRVSWSRSRQFMGTGPLPNPRCSGRRYAPPLKPPGRSPTARSPIRTTPSSTRTNGRTPP